MAKTIQYGLLLRVVLYSTVRTVLMLTWYVHIRQIAKLKSNRGRWVGGSCGSSVTDSVHSRTALAVMSCLMSPFQQDRSPFSLLRDWRAGGPIKDPSQYEYSEKKQSNLKDIFLSCIDVVANSIFNIYLSKRTVEYRISKMLSFFSQQ